MVHIAENQKFILRRVRSSSHVGIELIDGPVSYSIQLSHPRTFLKILWSLTVFYLNL